MPFSRMAINRMTLVLEKLCSITITIRGARSKKVGNRMTLISMMTHVRMALVRMILGRMTLVRMTHNSMIAEFHLRMTTGRMFTIS